LRAALRAGREQLPSEWVACCIQPSLVIEAYSFDHQRIAGADGILDRLVHNAHLIEMRGDSMRKNRAKPNT
jgi:DNA replication protein DnaC